MRAAPLAVEHDAFAELAVPHALPQADAALHGRSDRSAPIDGPRDDHLRADLLDELGGDLAQETRRRRERLGAVHATLLRMREVQLALGTRDADVAEAALLLETRGVVQRALMREQAVLHAAKEQQRELETLRGVQRHELYDVLIRVGLAVARLEHGEREKLRERRQVGLLRAHDLARGIDELLEVLDARFAAGIGVLTMMRDEAAALDDARDLLVQRVAARVGLEPFD